MTKAPEAHAFKCEPTASMLIHYSSNPTVLRSGARTRISDGDVHFLQVASFHS